MAYLERPADCPPDVDAIETYGGCWPADEPFPLTAEECLWLMRGYAIKPKAGITEAQFLLLPGRFEGGGGGDGRVVLWRA